MSLLTSVRQEGWDAAYYRDCCRRVAAGEFVDDDRLADWRFLTPITAKSDALVIGSGLGTVACCLAETCRTVQVVDPDIRRLHLLEHRCAARGLKNVRAIQLDDPRALPFLSASLDVISFRIDDWPMLRQAFSSTVHEFRRLLRDEGVVSLTVTNRWSPMQFLVGGRGQARGVASLRSYRHMLRRADFSPPDVYAVLPSSNATPLFWVPLNGAEAFEYFVESLFGLFDLASPEARSRYAWASTVARLGIWSARCLGVVRPAAQFVPAFGLIAGLRSREAGGC